MMYTNKRNKFNYFRFIGIICFDIKARNFFIFNTNLIRQNDYLYRVKGHIYVLFAGGYLF